MSSVKARVVMGVVASALLFSVPVIARVLASRTVPFNCVTTGSTVKVSMAPGATDAGVPTGEWGAYNLTNSDLPIVCPVQLEFDTAVSRTLQDVSFLAAGSSEVKCTYYLLDNVTGGGYTSPDYGGTTTVTSSGTTYTRAPPTPIQVANATLTRQFFYCILPKATLAGATGVLRALEVRYSE